MTAATYEACDLTYSAAETHVAALAGDCPENAKALALEALRHYLRLAAKASGDFALDELGHLEAEMAVVAEEVDVDLYPEG